MKKDLTGQWMFRSLDEAEYMTATVPGCQYTDLLAAGVIQDPFAGTNEKDCQWIHDKDYEYKKVFAMTAKELAAERIELVARRLDTICELYLNDTAIGYTDNCHLPHVLDVKERLSEGDNELRIIFRSPKKYVEQKTAETPAPVNSNGQNGIVHIRKPQCHFGWDWGPVLTPVGIGGDIYLDIGDRKRLGELYVETKKVGDGYTIFANCDNAERYVLTDPDGKSVTISDRQAEFCIENAQLWWTYELSGKDEQPLYTVVAEMTESNGKIQRTERKVGLRTIELNRQKDVYGYNFQFILNGVPIFVKGANYIPPDSFMTRYDRAQRDALLDAVRFSNMNMIRIWGGGYYADDELLDECDRRGILVWQDFMFACQAYPFFVPEFLNNVLQEVAYNVKRISSHPCLAVWCGNNEIEDMHMAWVTMQKYVLWTEKFFYHILPEELRKYDPTTPYTAGSPIGTEHNRNVGADFVGDTHLWGVWHGLQPMQYYRRRMTRFCSEFGFESLPCFQSIRSYAKPDEYPLSSAVQKAHQKCVNGNDKMLYYIASRFDLSDDIEDLVYLSQVTQQECIADATEHWRRNKGRCNGSMYWQLNDCWPTCSWSSYDYAGRYKALQYTARWFNAPLSVSIEDGKKEIKVFLLNDHKEAKEAEVEYVVFSFVGQPAAVERKSVSIGGVENMLVYTIPVTAIDAATQGLAVRLWQNGEMIMQKTHLLLPEKKLRLPRAPIQTTVRREGDLLKITLTSEVYQRLVMLDNEGEHFSDNYFDLLPGETKVVTQRYTSGCDSVTVRCVTDLKKTKKIKNLWARIKVFFSIRNISNALYHGRVPKQYSGKE